ncbi:hypothetical protein L6164_021029 [Bauhinia variegata]|uniref:Uncharacterized protein n=1 Tax=Bauhinia variegata TaxID=167791 RepID=A0ACB9MX95_BAUVA|nr:hypothetical protein L6164_021029 [Bauhinia variegata]
MVINIVPADLVSPAMSSLQGYYGLKPADRMPEGFEMALHSKDNFNSSENGSPSRNSPKSDQPLGLHRKSRSVANGLMDEILKEYDIEPVSEPREGNSDRWNDKLFRRRQKSEADFTRSHGLLMKEENGSSSGFSARTGNGLAQRPIAASRTALISDLDASGLNPVPIGLGDVFLTDGPSGVRKSSSMTCLHEQDNKSSSLRPTSRATAKPIFDGLSMPMTDDRSEKQNCT